jgi:hypothetical protein
LSGIGNPIMFKEGSPSFKAFSMDHWGVAFDARGTFLSS